MNIVNSILKKTINERIHNDFNSAIKGLIYDEIINWCNT